MLDAIRSFLDGFAPHPDIGPADPRVAVAALLVRAVGIDGVVTERERQALLRVLRDNFSLSEAQARALGAQARERDEESVDLYGFTSVLKRAFDEEGRRRVVEMLWEVVYADGTVSEFEDNLVWRVSELLGVSSRERLELRRQVRQQSGGSES